MIAAFLASAALAALLPLYTDEVAAKVEFARTLTEGGRLVSLLPQCKASWITPVPASWLPGALYYHVVFSRVGLLGIKLSAIVMAILWLGGVSWLLLRYARDRATGVRRAATFLSLHAIGIAPLTLISARAETTIIVALVAYVAFPILWTIDSRKTVAGRALVTVAFVFVTSIAFLTHPKMMFFAPVIFVSTAYTFGRRRPAWLVVAALFVGLTMAQTYVGAKTAVSCTESPDVERVLALQTLKASKAGVSGTIANAVANVDFLADGLAIDLEPRWLPLDRSGALPPFESLVARVSRAWFHLFVYGAPLFVGIVALRTLRRRAARPRALLAGALVVGVLANVVTKVVWPFYASAMVIGGLALAAVLAASILPFALPARMRVRARRLAGWGASALQLVALASMLAMALTFGAGIVGLARRDTTLYPEMPAWVPAYGFAKERPKIRAQAERCGIHGDASTHLVVDDETIFAFDDLHEPLNLVYVSDTTMWGNDRKGIRDAIFLAELDAPGIVSRCTYFPSALAAETKRDGDYCCVPRLLSMFAAAPLDFSDGRLPDRVLVDGWSFQEPEGRWTDGPAASFVFAEPGALPPSATLRFEVFAPLAGERHAQDVDVVLNGAHVGAIHVGEQDNDPHVVRAIPVAAPAALRHVNVVELRPRDHRPVAELGGTETRRLGIFLHRFWFD